MLTNVLTTPPAKSVIISATGTSASSAIDMADCDAIYVANTSATLYVAVRIGIGSAPTAVITTDIIVPPMSSAVIGGNSNVTHVAAIASGAGPTIVGFSPIRRGQ